MLTVLERANCAQLAAIYLGAACARMYWGKGIFDVQKTSKNGFASFFSLFFRCSERKSSQNYTHAIHHFIFKTC